VRAELFIAAMATPVTHERGIAQWGGLHRRAFAFGGGAGYISERSHLAVGRADMPSFSEFQKLISC